MKDSIPRGHRQILSVLLFYVALRGSEQMFKLLILVMHHLYITLDIKLTDDHINGHNSSTLIN